MLTDRRGTHARRRNGTPGAGGVCGSSEAGLQPKKAGPRGGALDYSYKPLVFVLLLAVAIPTAFILLSARLGPRRPGVVKLSPYESGILPRGTPEQRFPVKFYLVAVLFLLFDVEAVFLFPWAIRFRELGWFGFVEMTIFLAVLLLGLVYAWRKGALEWR